MKTIEKLARLLPELARPLAEQAESLREVRLRAGAAPVLSEGNGWLPCGSILSREALAHLLAALLEYSVHTREDELARGFFTLADGCRVGVCGAAAAETGRLAGIEGIGSLCVRIARAVPGCADSLMPHILRDGFPRSALLLSPPGLGKTTCLRDAARQLSLAGLRVAIADERHELAACSRGVPTLDVGPLTDVMDGGPKAATVPALLRSMSPDVIVADEIGSPGDAEALADARRCGVAVLASAHGDSLEALRRRRVLDGLAGVFDSVILLGGAPGRVKAVTGTEDGGILPCGCA